ncbi:Mechanosensitive ion channel protein 2, chloroplastic [Linum perenne]
MPGAGSLLLSHDLGLCKCQSRRRFKDTLARSKLSSLPAGLSSCVLGRDSRTLRMLGTSYRSTHSPHISNTFRCHSLLGPGQPLEVPAIKAASEALTRAYNNLQASPLVLRIAPAVGILVFALWGLAPVLRLIRNHIFRKNDNGWKKSNTYHVTNSYLQPLLLWAGALFICRVLDPVVLPTEASQVVKQRLLNFVQSLSTVLAFAYTLSRYSFMKNCYDSLLLQSFGQMGLDFVGKAIYSSVWVAAFSLFMELLGFSTHKWLTAGGLGTVLLTLAGREIFTNFLSSAMIHATRPFVVNEWIQTKIEGYEVSGTVEHVGWWSPTVIRGEDREAVHIPNHKFTMNVVRNLSQKSHWRIKTHLAISHLDVNKINTIVADMRKVLAKNPQVEQQRLHRRVFLENVNPENQALMILISCFVKTSHIQEYLCVKEAILLDLLRVISHHRARLATPIRTVQKIYTDADYDNVPFEEPSFNRGGVASNRPLLLIEPSYKVSGEDKTKSPSRSGRTVTEQDAKNMPRPSVDAQPASIPKSDSKVKESANATKAGAKISESPISDATGNTKKATSPADSRLEPSPSSSEYTGASKSQSKPGGERKASSSRPALEENIVLGVALEGSKRTLPINEEDSTSPPVAGEAKEMAAAASSATDKKKEDQVSTNSTPMPGDQ